MFPDFLSQWSTGCHLVNPACSVTLAAVFICAAFLVIPRTILLIGAGAVFGLKSLLIIVPSATLGSILSFLLARYVLSRWFQLFLERRPTLKAIAAAVDAEGWRVVAIMRLGVPVPSALQNYIFGLARIRVLPFAVATFIFSIPQTVLFVFLGSTGREALLSDDHLFRQLLLVLGGLSTVLLIVLIGRHARRELRMLSGSRLS